MLAARHGDDDDTLTARIRVFNSFSFLANTLISSMNIRWLIFSYDL